MLIIGSAAHFVACQACKSAGHIVFADGSESAHVATIEDSEKEILKAVEAKKLTDIELPELRRQIRETVGTRRRHAGYVLELILERRPDINTENPFDGCPTDKVM